MYINNINSNLQVVWENYLAQKPKTPFPKK